LRERVLAPLHARARHTRQHLARVAPARDRREHSLCALPVAQTDEHVGCEQPCGDRRVARWSGESQCACSRGYGTPRLLGRKGDSADLHGHRRRAGCPEQFAETGREHVRFPLRRRRRSEQTFFGVADGTCQREVSDHFRFRPRAFRVRNRTAQQRTGHVAMGAFEHGARQSRPKPVHVGAMGEANRRAVAHQEPCIHASRPVSTATFRPRRIDGSTECQNAREQLPIGRPEARER
jgi:hypothetical protein